MKLADLLESKPNHDFLVLNQIEKLWATGKMVKMAHGKTAYGALFDRFSWSTDNDGKPKTVRFINSSYMGGSRQAGEANIGRIDRLKLIKTNKLSTTGKEVWLLYDPKNGTPLREETREHLLRSLIRKIEPQVKHSRVYYQSSPHKRLVVSKIKFDVDPLVNDPQAMDFTFHPQYPSTRALVAMLPSSVIDDYTIKTFKDVDGETSWLIVKKDLADEAD